MRGTLAREQGVYRVSVGADGTPTAELVASSGRLPDLAMTREAVPTVVDFDDDGDEATFAWEFNKHVKVSLTLTHTAT